MSGEGRDSGISAMMGGMINGDESRQWQTCPERGAVVGVIVTGLHSYHSPTMCA